MVRWFLFSIRSYESSGPILISTFSHLHVHTSPKQFHFLIFNAVFFKEYWDHMSYEEKFSFACKSSLLIFWFDNLRSAPIWLIGMCLVARILGEKREKGKNSIFPCLVRIGKWKCFFGHHVHTSSFFLINSINILPLNFYLH